jgi:hypothetical protein
MIKSRRMRWAGHTQWKAETRKAYRILQEKPGEMRSPAISSRRWMDNTNTDLRAIGVSWDSAVGIASGLRAGRPKHYSLSIGRVKNFLFSTAFRPASYQLPIQWVKGYFPRE